MNEPRKAYVLEQYDKRGRREHFTVALFSNRRAAEEAREACGYDPDSFWTVLERPMFYDILQFRASQRAQKAASA